MKKWNQLLRQPVASLDQERDRRAIEHHYDLSNEFYALFLDPLLVYSCAYYRWPDASLERAQEDKLELVCRKLELGPGQRLLDVGCGWGSLAVWAATRHGADVVGLTLSAEQAAYGTAWAEREGIADRCRILHVHWRELEVPGTFDRIAAVGILEHVGVPRLPAFFGKLHGLLKPGGRFLNHGISRRRHWKHTPQWDFLIGHVFPNGDLIHVSHVAGVLEDVGFELLDLENLRTHYARTCRQWVERLREREERAIELVGRERYRTWLLYLAGSAVAFEDGWIGLHQIVAARPDPAERAAPRTREGFYRDFDSAVDALPGARRSVA